MRSMSCVDYTMSIKLLSPALAATLAMLTTVWATPAMAQSTAYAPALSAQPAAVTALPSHIVISAAPATVIHGFGLTYTAPPTWTLSGQQGRIHAWTNATKTAALVVYGGHFSSLELALGDAQRALGVPREEDLRIITPISPAMFGAFRGVAGSVRVLGQSPVVAHVAAAQLNDSTALGAVMVLDATAADSTLSSATTLVAQLLADARITLPQRDSALATRITGQWTVQTANTSSPTGAGYTNDESWTFAADGTFAYRKRFSVSMPGGNITPEERDDSGRWYAVGGAVVLVSDEGRLTVDVAVEGAKLQIDGTTFSRP